MNNTLVERLEGLLSEARISGVTVLDGHVPTLIERKLAVEIRDSLSAVREVLRKGSAGEIVSLAGIYCHLYLLAFRKMLPIDERIDYTVRAIRLWLNGDGSVGREELMGLLSPIIHGGVAALHKLDDRYRKWYFTVKDRWIRELMIHDTFTDATARQSRQRLDIILRADLSAYFLTPAAEATAKQRWRERNEG